LATYEKLAKSHGADWEDSIGAFVGKHGVLIPNHGTLRTRLFVQAHCGVSGHCGAATCLDQLQELVYWPGMRDDVEKIGKRCIHCNANARGEEDRNFGTQIAPTVTHLQKAGLDKVFNCLGSGCMIQHHGP
jgi:hypothetical protein